LLLLLLLWLLLLLLLGISRKGPGAMAEEELQEQILSEPLMDLSNLGRAVDGSGFVFRSVVCVGKRIGPIKAIEGYTLMQDVDLSENLIKDVASLKGLQFLLRLNLSSNAIVSLKGWESDEPTFPNLTHLDLRSNQLDKLSPMPFKRLVSVCLAKNEIASIQDFGGHETLESLDLSENKLSSLSGLGSLPALKVLNVSSNELLDINGLSEVPVLEDLNLAGNKFQSWEGSWQALAALRSLDLSSNQLESEKPLEVLRHLPLLRSLKVAGNPFAEALPKGTAAAHVTVLGAHWRLESIDGVPVLEEHLETAKGLNVQRILDERAQAKAEAEAAAAAAATEE